MRYKCDYTMEFPVDEFGRLGGQYSLADLPVAKFMELTREGIIESKDSEKMLYKVRDVEENFTEVLSMDDVVVGEGI